MRVLVLRPEPAASRTAGRLAALGHEAVLLPLTKAEHDVDAVRTALAAAHSCIAVTSAEVARLLGKLREDLAPHRSTTVFAVGQASADAMRDIGFSSVFSANGYGEDLARLIAAHTRDSGDAAGSILYLAGNPRAPGFENRLQEAGIAFRTVESYRMVPLALSQAETAAALLQPVPDAVLLYSRESARAFFGLAPLAETPEQFNDLRILCMSTNVAAAVPANFAAQALIAGAPNEESLLALL
ncbi:uroporphyrinogen-III synthase [Shinella zoogloeoides]|uniref:uroporphyrinogen-III synthase n=1 Tax=Shinella zoogloeoides TaxID=352475 RepID=UPI00273EF130|nr:uroporphyrinogen-III synthase [Shinella zoogloeoides]WLR92257.1 uroporphyrinogen-III synthase [Shinella zoogloeoides]